MAGRLIGLRHNEFASFGFSHFGAALIFSQISNKVTGLSSRRVRFDRSSF